MPGEGVSVSSFRQILKEWRGRLALIFLLLLGGVWSAVTIRFETELLPLLPGSAASVRGLQSLQQRFASDREIYLVADPAIPASERAELFQRLRPRLEQMPEIAAVAAPGEEFQTQLPETLAWILWNLPPERFAQTVTLLEPARVKEKLAQLPEELAGATDGETMVRMQLDPLGLAEALTSGQGGPNVGPTLPMSAASGGASPGFLIVRTKGAVVNFEECAQVTAAIDARIQEVLPGEKRLLLTGRPAITAEISQQMRSDMAFMVGAAAVLVCGMFWLFYRTLRPLGWILAFQFLALLAGLIIARIAFGSLNVISMGFASILLGVSMDYSVLVYHHFASEHRADRETWRRLRRGIWFSAITTAATFLILAFSSFPGLRQLSVLVAAGLLMSALFATWLLREVLSRKPPQAPPALNRASTAVASVLERRARWIALTAGAIVIAGAALVVARPASLYTPGMRQFQPTQSKAFTAQGWLLQQSTDASDALYIISGQEWSAILDAKERLAAQAKSGLSMWALLLANPAHQKENRALWPEPIAERLRGQFAEAEVGEEFSQNTIALATALDAAKPDNVLAAGFGGVQPLLRTIVTEDPQGGKYHVLLRVPGGANNPLPVEKLSSPPAEVLPVSWVSLANEITDTARADVTRLGLWMALALGVLCALAQRSVKLWILNFVALGVSLLLMVLLLAATRTSLSPLSLLSVPLLIGLVIDYSLHILMALDHGKGDLRFVYRQLAAPVILTGISACIGFGAPMLTRQPALQNFGIVMDLGILSAVATCLVLLPPLYRLMFRRQREAGV